MSFRRKKDEVAKHKVWTEFVHYNQALIAAIGIPEVIVATRENWVDFLMHGRFHDDQSYFHSWALDERKTQAFITLLENYFKAGYPYFEVTALGHQRYRDELDARLKCQ